MSPGGSSSGSAVAVAAGVRGGHRHRDIGLAVLPGDAERARHGQAAVGLVSRAGIVPIAHSQDTAGPLTRTVRDAGSCSTYWRRATRRSGDPGFASPGRLHCVSTRRVSRARGSACRATLRPGERRLFRQAVAALGAGDERGNRDAEGSRRETVRANIPTAGWIGGPGTSMAVLNRNPESRTKLAGAPLDRLPLRAEARP